MFSLLVKRMKMIGKGNNYWEEIMGKGSLLTSEAGGMSERQ